jgi:hypothetical protein
MNLIKKDDLGLGVFNKMAIDFLQKQSGNMHVKQGLLVIDTESLIRLPGIMKIQEAKSMK